MRMFDYTVSVRMLLKLAHMSSVHVVLLPFFKNFWQLKVVHVASTRLWLCPCCS